MKRKHSHPNTNNKKTRYEINVFIHSVHSFIHEGTSFILLKGRAQTGNSVGIVVQGFKPYFYREVDNNSKPAESLCNETCEKISKEFHVRCTCESIVGKPIGGFQENTSLFIKCTVNSDVEMSIIHKNYKRNRKLILWETEVATRDRFVADVFGPCNWIDVSHMKIASEKERLLNESVDVEYHVSWLYLHEMHKIRDVIQKPIHQPPPLNIISFALFCDGIAGSDNYPVACWTEELMNLRHIRMEERELVCNYCNEIRIIFVNIRYYNMHQENTYLVLTCLPTLKNVSKFEIGNQQLLVKWFENEESMILDFFSQILKSDGIDDVINNTRNEQNNENCII